MKEETKELLETNYIQSYNSPTTHKEYGRLYVNVGFHDGACVQLTFANGYTASLVQHSFSYGNERGLYEIAVMKDGEITYDTEITSDVEGHLTMDEAVLILKRIADL
jgi:hypothetical protein